MGAAAARKPVTILFGDLVGSTALGEELDAEALRALLGRWHEAMRRPIEQHGGTVEKFVGDAVMAVFGVPRVHEDDALRAVQAALRMREALERLNEELARTGLRPLEIRIGIQSGEVVAGEGAATLVTGDAVNTAKRLEEAAAAGEILVGESTRQLVANAVVLEPAGAVEAKGKAQPVPAHRVVAAIEGAGSFSRRLDAPLIGRARELAQLELELETAIRERSCRVVTVYGEAGIGKSRLAAELASHAAERVDVLTARCVPYGDGITFLPLRELLDSAGASDRVEAGTAEETMSIVRRLLETHARTRPLVVCVEDVHWAEPTFLDLLEYVAAWSDDAPILLLCLARPELVDMRPRWPGVSITLRPLSEQEAEALLDALETEWPLTAELRTRIAEAAEGNPLFVEQLVAMLSETDAAAAAVPPTIQALLAARLDRLEPLERTVLERAAVIGREFSRAALAELSPADERAALAPALLALVRKELLRPAPSRAAADEALRFGHALIRDAAYAEIPKTTRAHLHERFARWLDAEDGPDELVGYHLEQAYRCTVDLGAPDDELGERAAHLLAAAGRRAFAREDMAAAANLLDRALLLAGLGSDRPTLFRELGTARFRAGDVAGAAGATDEAIELALALGDRREEWYARLDRAARQLLLGTGDDELAAIGTQAIRVFTELGDEQGLARAWRRLSHGSLREWRFGDAIAQAEHALEHVRRANDPAEHAGLADQVCTALLLGAEPADSAERRARGLLAQLDPEPPVRAAVESTLACLVAMQGRFDEARALATDAAATYDELGVQMIRAGLAELEAWIEELAGDLAAAERHYRLAFDMLEERLPALAGLQAARLARVAAERGCIEEADERLAFARVRVSRSDAAAAVELALAEARVALVHGRRDDAEHQLDAALAGVADSECLNLWAQTLALRAEIRDEEPVEALELYERKGNTAAAERLRELVNTRLPR